jgi:hypothetical protein
VISVLSDWVLALFRRQLLCKDRSELYFEYQNVQEVHLEH